MKKGISLITLVITIIIVIILATAIIMGLSGNDMIGMANEGRFKSDVDIFKTELTNWIADEYIKAAGNLDLNSVNATKDGGTYRSLKITDIIQSMKATKYKDMFVIKKGELVYVGDDATIVAWCDNVCLTDSSSYIDIFSDGMTTYAILDDGTVNAWGNNDNYKLGNKTDMESAIPIKVSNISDVKTIVSNEYNVFVLLNSGKVMAWGDNGRGQLGDGTTENKMIPSLIPNLTDVKQIALIYDSVYALLSNGTVKVWGYNIRGELGLGNTNNVYTPTAIDGLQNVKEIICQEENGAVYALLNDGKVKTWGYNEYGQLGDGTYDEKFVPTDITTLNGVIQILVGEKSAYALLDTGKAMAWGNNEYGQLGIGNNNNVNIPTEVINLENVDKITCCYYSAYALLNDGTVKAWGNNEEGQLGNNTNENTNRPDYVLNLENINEIYAGSYNAFALLNNGEIKVWGNNQNGQLGVGTNINQYTPQTISGITNVKRIKSTYNCTYIILNDGGIRACGYNEYGILGNGTKGNKNVFTDISNASSSNKNINKILVSEGNNILAISEDGALNVCDPWADEESLQIQKTYMKVAGISNVKDIYWGDFILLNDGKVKAWGNNEYGQLGDGTYEDRNTPVDVVGLTDVKQIINDYDSVYALLNDGKVKAWGNNEYGQLGDGTYENRITPDYVLGLENVKEVTTGVGCGYALLNDGRVKAWGYDAYVRQLGSGTNESRNTAEYIEGLNDVKRVIPAYPCTYALLNNGQVMVWGKDERNLGLLGIPNVTDISVPTLIPNLENVKELYTKYDCVYALLNDGTVKAWGMNYSGRLGIGTNADSNVPTEVYQLENVKDLYAGEYSVFALLNTGEVKAWGNNYYGQLCNGNTTDSNMPISISITDSVKKIYSYDDCTFILLNNGKLKACGKNNTGQVQYETKGNNVMNLTTIEGIENVKDVFYGYNYTVILLEDGNIVTLRRNTTIYRINKSSIKELIK